MNKLKRFWKWLNEPAVPQPTTTLGDILDNYTIVDVVPGDFEHGPFVIVTDKNTVPHYTTPDGISLYNAEASDPIFMEEPPVAVVKTATGAPGRIQLREKPELGELANASPSPFTAGFRREYNRELQGLSGLEKWDKARKSDGVIAGTIMAVKTPVFSGNWRIDPVSDSKPDKKIAEFIWKCLTEYQSITWTQILIDAMLCVDFGYSIFEKVWEIREIDGKERVVLQKLAPRHPMDVKEVKYDKNGGPKSIVFFVKIEPTDNEYFGGQKEVEIPISKLLVIPLQREVGDIQGRSIIRVMYQHYYYKTQLYKIDAIQKERHGIGIPVIKLPVGFDRVKDTAEANQLGRNLRTNERAHIVLPPNWEITFAKLEGQPVDAMKSIEYHDNAIRESILAGFLGTGRTTKEEDLGLFLKSTRFIADSICDAFNTYIIPEIIKYNYDNKDVPKLQVRQIGEQADNRTMSFAIRNMVGAGIIRPDDRLEDYIRNLLDLPPVDLATVRVVKAPQAPGAAGATQQGPLPNATPGTQTQLKPGEQPKPGDPQSSGKENPATNTPGLPRQTPLPNVGTGGAKVGDNRGQ